MNSKKNVKNKNQEKVEKDHRLKKKKILQQIAQEKSENFQESENFSQKKKKKIVISRKT